MIACVFYPSSKREQGVSLLELLTVIAIISILFGFIFPALFRARGRARTTVCIVHLRQIALATRAYADDFDGSFPTSIYDDPFPEYLVNQNDIFICPGDDRDLSNPGDPRGSYGLNSGLSSYKLTNMPEIDPVKGNPIPVVGDSDEETLDPSKFSSRHQERGNIAFNDGHVKSVTDSEIGDYF